jgi:hypothetical protein
MPGSPGSLSAGHLGGRVGRARRILGDRPAEVEPDGCRTGPAIGYGAGMAAISPDQIRDLVAKFVPRSVQDNVFIKSLLAGATAVGIILSSPVFGAVGTVSAAGWIIVYIVTGGTFSYEIVTRAIETWRTASEAERAEVDAKLQRLKKALDDGDIDEGEYKQRARQYLDRLLG